ncbi:MAG: hypothetical protein Q8N88_01200 [Nanoarchaeota archaeon]|nr:hypothetical protein [Nanoarchaeota archaeon]
MIHRKVYYEKGIGLAKSTWEINLNKNYHSNHQKIVQLYYFDEGKVRIAGYNIFLKPILIKGNSWSKIIEGGVAAHNESPDNKTFLSMYRDLLNWDFGTSYIVEASISSNGVTRLLLKAGFGFEKDQNKIDSIFPVFLNSTNYLITSSDGKCIIKRSTAINNSYEGYIVIYKSKIINHEYN